MDAELWEAAVRLLSATLAGGIIGLERAYNGRAAGFRTHILVSLASALLMLLMQYQWLAVPSSHLETIRVDPTRMAQGIMTGIGFLGAGVILHYRQSIRGLTTAASIWITAAIGIILGSGFYLIGTMAVALVLGTLSLFRWVESHLPARHYAQLTVEAPMEIGDLPAKLRELMKAEELRMGSIAFAASREEGIQEVKTTISTFHPGRFERLQRQLLEDRSLSSYRIVRGDS